MEVVSGKAKFLVDANVAYCVTVNEHNPRHIRITVRQEGDPVTEVHAETAATMDKAQERRREIEHLTHVAIENWADLDFELLTPATKGELEQLLDRHLRIGQRIVDLEMEEKFGR